MVLKLRHTLRKWALWFENDVEMYGAQTEVIGTFRCRMFENDVEMYGAQTSVAITTRPKEFENDVEMYGAQTLMT